MGLQVKDLMSDLETGDRTEEIIKESQKVNKKKPTISSVWEFGPYADAQFTPQLVMSGTGILGALNHYSALNGGIK